MGYRTWNNYEEAAEAERRAAWAALPPHKRIVWRLRLIAIVTVIFGLPTLLIARGIGLF